MTTECRQSRIRQMDEISMRDFQRHASDYVDRLPVVLTRYGKPIAKIVGLEGKETVDTQELREMSDKETHVENSKKGSVDSVPGSGVEEKEMSDKSNVDTHHGVCIFCKKHRQVAGAELELPSGELKDIDICEECFGGVEETGANLEWK